MLDFVRRHRLPIASSTLLGTALLLLSASARYEIRRDPLGRLMAEALAPLERAMAFLRTEVAGTWTRFRALGALAEENAALARRLEAWERTAARLAELEAENRRLAALLELRAVVAPPSWSARVIGRDPLPWFRTLTIDRGRADGVRVGMGVLVPAGVLGRVVQVGAHAAQVLLLTDHNSAVDAIVQRSRARGIVQGVGGAGCELRYLRRDADVAPGDRVVTSGLDGIFPKGLPIGTVLSVESRDRGLLQAATLRPAARFDHVEEVLVVAPPERGRPE